MKYKPRLNIENCVICGNQIAVGVITGYVVLENLTETINMHPFCSHECAEKYIKYYAHPMFQNQTAFEKFTAKHPICAKRILESKKPIIFIDKEAELAKPQEPESDCIKELRDDFRRVYREQWGEEP